MQHPNSNIRKLIIKKIQMQETHIGDQLEPAGTGRNQPAEQAGIGPEPARNWPEPAGTGRNRKRPARYPAGQIFPAGRIYPARN